MESIFHSIEKIFLDASNVNKGLSDIKNLAAISVIEEDYIKIYNRSGKMKYKSIIKAKNQCGIYFIINGNKVLYIGQSSYNKTSAKWDLYHRVQQHFRDSDTGGLRSNLSKRDKKLLNNKTTKVVIMMPKCKEKENRREILFLESLLIGIYKPKFNFYEKKV